MPIPVFPKLRSSIKTRIIASMLIVIMCTGVIASVTIVASNHLVEVTTELNTIDLPEILVLEQLQMTLEQQHVGLQQVTLYEEPIAGSPNIPPDTAQMQQIEQSLNELPIVLSQQRSVNDASIEHSLLLHLQQYRTLVLTILLHLRHGEQNQAKTLYNTGYVPLLATVLQQTSQLNSLEKVEAQQATAQSQQGTQQLTILIFSILMIMMAFTGISAAFLIRSLVRPLRALLLATQADVTGDFTQQTLVVERNDELGKLTESFNTMQARIRTLIRSLRTEREFTQKIIDTSTDGIAVIDDCGTIVVMNPALARIVGQTVLHDAINIIDVLAMLHCSPLFDLALMNQIINNESQVELMIQTGPGRHAWFAASCVIMTIEDANALPLTARTITGAVYHLTLHDSTDRKRIEQAQSDFIALVSHELRAPLTSVTSSVELLQSIDPLTSNEAFHEVTGILAQQTIRLNNVIEEVLLVTRIEANQQQMRREKIEIVSFVNDLLQRVRIAWLGNLHQITFQYTGESAKIVGDRSLLEMALRNILENARKYAIEDSTIQVSLRQAITGDGIEIAIYNQGPTIPADDRERIFDRFERGGDTTRYRGYGLGLYITQHILQAMQGTIRSEPCEDGALFIVTLPKEADEVKNGNNDNSDD